MDSCSLAVDAWFCFAFLHLVRSRNDIRKEAGVQPWRNLLKVLSWMDRISNSWHAVWYRIASTLLNRAARHFEMKLGLLHSRVIMIQRKVLNKLKLTHNCFNEFYKIQRSQLLLRSYLKSNSPVNRKSQPINIMNNSASQAKSTGFWRYAKTISRNVYILIRLFLIAHQSKSQVLCFQQKNTSVMVVEYCSFPKLHGKY